MQEIAYLVFITFSKTKYIWYTVGGWRITFSQDFILGHSYKLFHDL